ncbi:hypothetical protein GCM10011507_17810 [Edaphobacter acidisoli]|uniref:DUF91 domain-containing protein n=1 Tax=Edaphobacter acidisoli TaxID=2040573 RepID=A0A916RQS3_9BACT|nr:hypothetical protein [Edaphobacter acidisoli]GGA66727.1 hypothetical protein GCM10011507_17810 [Edaphobacter acidisoli]
MPTHRSVTAGQEQTAEQIATAIEAFLAEHPHAAVLEEGKAIFDMREAKYSLDMDHGRCTLHLWSEQRNIVRRITGTRTRDGILRMSALRFGQSKPQSLELIANRDRRTPSTREATRVKYLRVLERVLVRNFPEFKPEAFRTAMDLEHSFGPAYARGSLVQGQKAWAVIGVNDEESHVVVDGILTLGILWLNYCRELGDGRRVYQGLKMIVPRGMSALTLSRLAWLNPALAQWELWELDQATEELEQRDAADHGNLLTRLVRAPNIQTARDRFAASAERVMALVPETMRGEVEQRIRSGTELAFLLHGLEFARVRMGYSGNSFNSAQEITFGAGANETSLTDANEMQLRELISRLFARRVVGGDTRDPLYRMQPERWLESVLRRDVEPIDSRLDPKHVYTQVPAFAASDRGMLDLLSVSRDGRLAVIELKADEDLHLALQGLDYWVHVRWHHLQNPDQVSGLGEFQRHGYFGGIYLSADAPRLYLVAPALRVHPATDIVLKHLSPRVEWMLVALGERWREQVKVIWRKRSGE